jgi:hypothetical protein
MCFRIKNVHVSPKFFHVSSGSCYSINLRGYLNCYRDNKLYRLGLASGNLSYKSMRMVRGELICAFGSIYRVSVDFMALFTLLVGDIEILRSLHKLLF